MWQETEGSVEVLWVGLAVGAIISKVQLAVLTVVERPLWPLSMTLTTVIWQCQAVPASFAAMWLVLGEAG
jgi:hypothetical protein